MPIISIFPTGTNGGGSGSALGAVSNITTLTSYDKAYFKWTDPDDVVVDGTTVATFAGTLLVRKAGSVPANRTDGTLVLDSTTKNAYQNTYFCDDSLADGVTYYYKFFSYTTQKVYTNSPDNVVSVTPDAIAPQNVSNLSAEAAGNGKVLLKWDDPDDTTQDGITLVSWGGSKVIYKKDSAPTDEDDGTLVLNSTTKDAYKTTGLIISGLENDATYYFAVFPYGSEASGGAINTNTANIVSGVPSRFVINTVPSQSGTLTYNTSIQTPVWNNYDATKMTVSVIAQVNAGTYVATFTPLDDYEWSDGSTGAKSVNWTIDKAAGSLSLSKTTITLNVDKTSDTFEITRVGDGMISVVSDDTNVTTEMLNSTVIITVRNTDETSGSANITVSVGEGTNYLAPASANCIVEYNFMTPFNDYSWSEIKAISDAGTASSYFAVGDCKAVTLNGAVGDGCTFNNETYYCFIIGIDHNEAIEGANRIHLQFGKTALTGGTDICFVDSGYGSKQTSGAWFNMNNTYANTGGWNRSRMRTVICPAFKNALPSELRNILKTVTKYSDNTGGGSDTASYVTATSDEIFLLAEFEVFGKRIAANSAEQNYQQQYDYYASGNSKRKYKHNDIASIASWWVRSARADTSYYLCRINTSGGVNPGYTYNSYGFAPAFCI